MRIGIKRRTMRRMRTVEKGTMRRMRIVVVIIQIQKNVFWWAVVKLGPSLNGFGVIACCLISHSCRAVEGAEGKCFSWRYRSAPFRAAEGGEGNSGSWRLSSKDNVRAEERVCGSCTSRGRLQFGVFRLPYRTPIDRKRARSPTVAL
jgi:hypothetical protein